MMNNNAKVICAVMVVIGVIAGYAGALAIHPERAENSVAYETFEKVLKERNDLAMLVKVLQAQPVRRQSNDEWSPGPEPKMTGGHSFRTVRLKRHK